MGGPGTSSFIELSEKAKSTRFSLKTRPVCALSSAGRQNDATIAGGIIP